MVQEVRETGTLHFYKAPAVHAQAGDARGSRRLETQTHRVHGKELSAEISSPLSYFSINRTLKLGLKIKERHLNQITVKRKM